jgi:serine/threonine protein kinase
MKMIAFDPNQRISAEDALKDPYFDDIRLEDQEENAQIEIDLSFIDKYHEGQLSPDEMKALILKYISDLSKDVKGDIEAYIKENYE